MDLGDRHQTTPREATNDPGNDNINALKNAHLTPRAIKAVQRGVDIKNEDSTEDSTTNGRKSSPAPKKKATPKPVRRQSLATPKPVKKNNLSTKVQNKPASPSKTSRSVSKAPKPVSRSTPTPAKKGGTRSPFVSLIDLM